MHKVIVLFKEGFEEIEALSVVDVLRRAKIECLMVGMDSLEVTSNHNITVKMDQIFDDSLSQVDMVVLPGGMPGAKHLKNDARVISLLQSLHTNNAWVAAICAAPIVLQEAGLLDNVNVTCFPGFEKELQGANVCNSLVEVNRSKKIITSRGPATALLFAYTILEELGVESQELQEGMQFIKLKEAL